MAQEAEEGRAYNILLNTHALLQAVFQHAPSCCPCSPAGDEPAEEEDDDPEAKAPYLFKRASCFCQARILRAKTLRMGEFSEEEDWGEVGIYIYIPVYLHRFI